MNVIKPHLLSKETHAATLPQDCTRLTRTISKKSEGCNQRTLNVYPIRITFLSLSLFRRCLDDFIRLQRYILFFNLARFSALKLLNDAINLHLRCIYDAVQEVKHSTTPYYIYYRNLVLYSQYSSSSNSYPSAHSPISNINPKTAPVNNIASNI